MYHDQIDPDALQDELHRLGDRSEALRKRGTCPHGWWTHLTCNYCGKTWTTEADMMREHRDLLRG